MTATSPGSLSEPAHVDVFISGQDGYNNYRIPAIAVAPDGTILALAEARSAGDPGEGESAVDLVCKRSADNGRTWSALQLIEHAGPGWSSANPAAAADRRTGRIWLLYLRCKPGRGTSRARAGTDDFQTLARFSDDCGKSWSDPTDLTAIGRDMNDPHWRATVIGPGGMIQDRRDRLVAPAWRVDPPGVFAIFSEDHGRTWQRGEIASHFAGVPGPHALSEDQLVELSDGRLLLDCRDERIPWRLVAESRDGGRTWGEFRRGIPAAPVACAIERCALQAAGGDRDRILWTGPKNVGSNLPPKWDDGRKNLVARISYDEGRTFSCERLIAAGPAAYSDLAILADGSAGVLWERGDYRFITFTRLDREFLRGTSP